MTTPAQIEYQRRVLLLNMVRQKLLARSSPEAREIAAHLEQLLRGVMAQVEEEAK